jgi:hypothetical protein
MPKATKRDPKQDPKRLSDTVYADWLVQRQATEKVEALRVQQLRSFGFDIERFDRRTRFNPRRQQALLDVIRQNPDCQQL